MPKAWIFIWLTLAKDFKNLELTLISLCPARLLVHGVKNKLIFCFRPTTPADFFARNVIIFCKSNHSEKRMNERLHHKKNKLEQYKQAFILTLPAQDSNI